MLNKFGTDLGELSQLKTAKSRMLSPENPTGEPGKGAMLDWTEGGAGECARDLGKGWKVNPWIKIPAKTVHTLANITGPGIIQNIWMTGMANWRHAIIRFYWDDQDVPSVEAPIGDFFATGWGQYAQINSLAVTVNPGLAFNSYWIMPFKKKCVITIENMSVDEMILFYTISYALTEVSDDIGYFHAQFRRVNPLPYKEVYTIVDNIKGHGHYVGTYMAWQVNNAGWWGEGEIKFYFDGDKEYPTIVGTGTEDYFGGSYNFEDPITKQYLTFTTPHVGFHQIIRPDGLYRSQMRFGMYRWHIVDPIIFTKELKVTIQALGWRSHGRYLALQDDISSVAYWYQTLPTNPFPEFYTNDQLEII